MIDYKSLIELNIDNLFGIGALDLFRSIPTALENNYDAIASDLNGYAVKIQSFVTLYTSINTFRKELGINSSSQKSNQGELIIIYEYDADIKDLAELSKASTESNQIINFIGRLTRENDTNIEIKSLEKGSLILTIVLAVPLIQGLIKCIDKILDLISKTYDLKNKSVGTETIKTCFY